jgi:hypothetical protein
MRSTDLVDRFLLRETMETKSMTQKQIDQVRKNGTPDLVAALERDLQSGALVIAEGGAKARIPGQLEGAGVPSAKVDAMYQGIKVVNETLKAHSAAFRIRVWADKLKSASAPKGKAPKGKAPKGKAPKGKAPKGKAPEAPPQ